MSNNGFISHEESFSFRRITQPPMQRPPQRPGNLEMIRQAKALNRILKESKIDHLSKKPLYLTKDVLTKRAEYGKKELTNSPSSPQNSNDGRLRSRGRFNIPNKGIMRVASRRNISKSPSSLSTSIGKSSGKSSRSSAYGGSGSIFKTISAPYSFGGHRREVSTLQELINKLELARSIKGEHWKAIDIERAQREQEIRKLRELSLESKKKSVILPLSDIQLAKVKKALQTPYDFTITQKFNIAITGKDIQTLADGAWLNDEVINFYVSLIAERSKNSCDLPKVHSFSSFFYTQLSKKGYDGVRRWAKRAKVEIAKMDYVLIPVNISNTHWVLSVINLKKKRFEYYDSLGYGAGSILEVCLLLLLLLLLLSQIYFLFLAVLVVNINVNQNLKLYLDNECKGVFNTMEFEFIEDLVSTFLFYFIFLPITLYCDTILID